MEVKLNNCCINLIVFCALLCVVCCINLPSQTTRKPRITKYMTTTSNIGSMDASASASVTETPVIQKDQPIYRVTTKAGSTCVLMTSDALIEIRLKTNIGDEKIDAFVPDKVMVEGECRYEDTATMIISWPGYRLEWIFAKTPGGERWYVDKISLIVSASTAIELHHYHTITTLASTFTLTADNNLFPTPVGRSYSCAESVVEMVADPDKTNLPGLTGTLYLRAFQLQPFMYKGAQFAPEFECSAQASIRDETAPIAVGSTLAVAVLCLITGYGAWRYFKVTKVQYNTME